MNKLLAGCWKTNKGGRLFKKFQMQGSLTQGRRIRGNRSVLHQYVRTSGSPRTQQVDFFNSLLSALLLIHTLGGAVLAQTLSDRVVEHTLSNGLKILMVERHTVPTISFQITYKVGSVNETNGITGIAHLYEHMAFKGTERLGTIDYEKERPLLEALEKQVAELNQAHLEKGKPDAGRIPGSVPGDIDTLKKAFETTEKEARAWVVNNELGEIYNRNGAAGFNATTGRDVTSYTVSLPANRLPLWLALESDRMAHSVLREFYKEKEVVLEERRLRVETNPMGKLYEAFFATAFAAHPYAYPTLGWPSDLSALSATRTAEFFKTHYGPNNTVIAMVGDFKAAEVILLLERYFGPIPAVAIPPAVVTVEPPQEGERRVEVTADAHPQIVIGYHKPAISHPDDAALDVIDALLSEGRSSRLNKLLVEEKKIAIGVSTQNGTPGARFPNLFAISATPRAPHTTAELEEAIDAELARMKREPPTEKELEKVIANIDAALIRSLRVNSGLAAQLAYFEAVAGSWRYLLSNREAISKVTGEEVMRVAQTYFTKSNRTVATLVKTQKISERQNFPPAGQP